MVTGIGQATDAIVSTVEYIALVSSAANTIKPDWSTCVTIERVEPWDCTLVDNIQIKVSKRPSIFQNKIDS